MLVLNSGLLTRCITTRAWCRYPTGHSVTILLKHRAVVLRNAGRLFSKSAKPVGNKTNNKGTFKRILLLAKDEKWKIAAAIILLGISSSVTMSVPFGIGRIIDIIYTPAGGADGAGGSREEMVPRLRAFCLVLLCVFCVGAAANFGRIYLMQMTGNRIVKRMREKLYASIVRQEVAFFDRTKTGELINRLSGDTSLVGQSVTMNISDGLRSAAQTVAGVSMMIYMAPKLTLLALSIVPPVALLSRYYGRFVQSITRKVQDSLADSTNVAEEKISNIRTVRAFVQETKEINLYSDKVNTVLNYSKKEALAKASFWTMTGFSGNMIILSVFYNGGMMMSDHAISVGELSSFLLYAAFVGVSIGGMSTFYSEMMKGLGASHRIFEIIDDKPTINLTDGIIPNEPILGNIEIKNVQFSYPERSDVAIFNDLSLTIGANSMTAIVGSSGCGKSTVTSLLLRYYDVNQGSITIDGHNVKDLNATWLRSNIGIVNQEPLLFSCSIFDNIRYGSLNEDVSLDDVIAASKIANAYEFITKFPEGFDTLVGERGIMLSGGQKQRVAIARAILKDPKILLFDEATSALDSESEHLVQDAMKKITQNRTVITIAHRLSTIQNADNIAVLDNGIIVESGSYSELTSFDGKFKKLVDRQMLNETNNKKSTKNEDLIV